MDEEKRSEDIEEDAINEKKKLKYLKNKFILVFIYTFSALILFLKIVNNGKILTDDSSTREKNCLERDL